MNRQPNPTGLAPRRIVSVALLLLGLAGLGLAAGGPAPLVPRIQDPKPVEDAEKPESRESQDEKPAEKPDAEATPRRPAARPGNRTRPRPAPATPPLAIEGVRVLRAGQPDLEEATVLIRGKKIVAVGKDVQIPPGARVIDGEDAVLTAGWIDARGTTPLLASSIQDPSDSGAWPSALEALDFVDRDERVRSAVSHGVTSVYVAAGSGLVAGEGALVRLRPKETDLEKLAVPDAEAVTLVGGAATGQSAVARLNGWSSLRKTLRDAQKYREKLDEYEEEMKKYQEARKAGKPVGAARPVTEKTDAPVTGPAPPFPTPRRRRPPRTDEERDLVALSKALGLVPIVEDRDGGVILDGNAPEPAAHEDDDGHVCACGTPGAHANHPAEPPFPDYYFQEPNEGEPKEGEKKDEAKGDPKIPTRPNKPPFDYRAESLLGALRREMPVRIEARHADEIKAAIDLVQHFKLRAVLEGLDEAHLVLDELAKAEIPVVLAPVRSDEPVPGNARTRDLAARLQERGISFAIGTGRQFGATQWIRAQVALAVAGGLSRDAALAAVTTSAASLLGVSDRLGSVEPGRDADLVLFAGDPFDPATPVRMTIVEGDVVYER